MYKIALIGYGYWGKILLPYFDQFFNVRLIFGRSVKKKGRFTNDLNDVFSSGIDAVAIATPIGTHCRIVLDALKHGKHVFCEKPLAIEPSLVRKLNFIAIQKGVHLITDYTYTFSRKLKKIQNDIVNNNKIGKLHTMILTFKRNSGKDDVDIYWNLASHMLAVLDMFVDIRNLKFNKTDLVSQKKGIISFTGNIKGRILVDSDFPDKETEVDFSGDVGMMTCLDLHKKEEGLIYAMEYFKGVLDGSIENKTNIERAIAVTNVLWRLKCI